MALPRPDNQWIIFAYLLRTWFMQVIHFPFTQTDTVLSSTTLLINKQYPDYYPKQPMRLVPNSGPCWPTRYLNTYTVQLIKKYLSFEHTDTDSRLAESTQESFVVNAETMSSVLGIIFGIDLSLFLTLTLLELHFSHVHDTCLNQLLIKL